MPALLPALLPDAGLGSCPPCWFKQVRQAPRGAAYFQSDLITLPGPLAEQPGLRTRSEGWRSDLERAPASLVLGSGTHGFVPALPAPAPQPQPSADS